MQEGNVISNYRAVKICVGWIESYKSSYCVPCLHTQAIQSIVYLWLPCAGTVPPKFLRVPLTRRPFIDRSNFKYARHNIVACCRWSLTFRLNERQNLIKAGDIKVITTHETSLLYIGQCRMEIRGKKGTCYAGTVIEPSFDLAKIRGFYMSHTY